MTTLTQNDLLKAGVHLGHIARKWNPQMAPFIFMKSHGMHIIDLYKTLQQLKEANNLLTSVARSGSKILFVATKKQAKEFVTHIAQQLNMPYVTERWLGGTLTNFITIRKLVKKLTSMDRMIKSTAYKNMAKKEQLMIARDRKKLDRVLGGILDMTKLPGALVVVDIIKENIAVQEANKLGIPVIALTDTNTNPNLVDFPIPSNDDATPSISILINAISDAIATGLAMRQEDKEIATQEKEEEAKLGRARGVEKVVYAEEEAYDVDIKKGKNREKSVEGVEKIRKNKTNEAGDQPMGKAAKPRKRIIGSAHKPGAKVALKSTHKQKTGNK